MLKKIFFVFILIIFTLFTPRVNAQLQSGDIVLDVNPRYPKANEQVHASVSTFTTDLNSARISWKLNGENVLEGIGKKSFSFTLNDSGFPTTLEVKIETISGSIINKKITINTSDVDMLWEAYNTYTPPFYKGKALAPIEGNIKIVAIPKNQSITGLNYKWKQDDKNKPSSSGYEKNYYLYKNSYLEDSNTTEVTISDLFGNNLGVGKVSVGLSNPKIIFYKKDPILGTKWEESLSDGFFISQEGETIVAEPYFFSNKDLDSSVYEFKWFLNGEESNIPDQKNFLAIKPEAGKSGNTAIKIMINNTKTLFQSLSKQINVNF